MYEQSLTQAGLTEEMAQIYEFLIKNGPQNAGKLAKKLGIKRGLTYKSIERLIKRGLVEKIEEPQKVAYFKANHPLKLQVLVENRQQRAKNAQLAIDGVLPNLVSDFNLLTGKPDVVYFEGDDGIKRVVMDSLSAKGEIYQYIDNEAANRYFPKINNEYIKKRKELGIKKKMITIDNEFIRKQKDKYASDITDIHLIDGANYPFATAMQIYDNKVSYLTLSPNKKIGIIIEDADIAKMHRTIFEYMWKTTKPLFEKENNRSNQTIKIA